MYELHLLLNSIPVARREAASNNVDVSRDHSSAALLGMGQESTGSRLTGGDPPTDGGPRVNEWPLNRLRIASRAAR